MKKSNLTIAQQSRISFAVQQGLMTADWEYVSLLSGGLSGVPVCKISVNQKFYVVKLDELSDTNFNLVRNYALLEHVSKQGIAPPVYFTDAEHGVILMKYIDVKPRPPATLESVKQFAYLLRKLHDGTSFSPWKSKFEILDYFYQQLTPEHQASSLIKTGIREVKRLHTYLSDPADMRPCHCDLNPNNLLFDGQKYYLVDWQAASPQSFYFDLASSANFFYFYSEEWCQLFLKEYFGRSTHRDENEKFKLMRKFTHIYYGIVFIALPLLKNIQLSPLSEQEIASLPSYLEFMQLLGSGKVTLSDPKTQQRFGYIFLKTADLTRSINPGT